MKAITNYLLNKLGQPLPLIVIFTSIFLVLVFTFIVKTRPQYDLLKFQSKAEHAQYQFVRLNTTTALCLDGSPGGYYISKDGDPNKILLFFQGGGWCYGKNTQQTLQNCYGRSKTIGGTTRHHPQQNFLKYSQGILSNYPQNNFKDWKKVYFLYCDGSGHQGTKLEPVQVKDTKLYFRGYNITTERFQDLQKKIGLFSKASQVVVSGCSAGGLAAYQWANYIAQRVKNGKVRVVADSGIFYDAYNVHSQSVLLREQYKTLMQIVNKQIDLPASECLKKNPLEKQKCMFAQNLLEQIKVPVFAIQGLYDEWSVQNILGIKCLDYYSQKKCTPIQRYVMQDNRRNVLKVLDEMKKKQKNGAWAPSCSVHCFTTNSAYFNEKFRIPSESQNSISFAVQNWLKNSTSSHFNVDQEKWPSNKKCSGINQFV